MNTPLLVEQEETKSSCWVFLKKIIYGRNYEKEETVDVKVLNKLTSITKKISELKKLKLRIEQEIKEIKREGVKLKQENKINEFEQKVILCNEKESFLETLNAIITKFEVLRSELKKAQVLNSCYNSLKDLNEMLDISTKETLDIDKVDRLMATIDENMYKSNQVNKALSKPLKKPKTNVLNNNNNINEKDKEEEEEEEELPNLPKNLKNEPKLIPIME